MRGDAMIFTCWRCQDTVKVEALLAPMRAVSLADHICGYADDDFAMFLSRAIRIKGEEKTDFKVSGIYGMVRRHAADRRWELRPKLKEVRARLQAEHHFFTGVERVSPQQLMVSGRQLGKNLLNKMIYGHEEGPGEPITLDCVVTLPDSLRSFNRQIQVSFLADYARNSAVIAGYTWMDGGHYT